MPPEEIAGTSRSKERSAAFLGGAVARRRRPRHLSSNAARQAREPQRRTARLARGRPALLVLKLVTGIVNGSLGLVSEALHSDTDLVAALLRSSPSASRSARRPAPRVRPRQGRAPRRAGRGGDPRAAQRLRRDRGGRRRSSESTPRWGDPGRLTVIGVVIAIDATRLSFRAARRTTARRCANALHFGSDLAGSWPSWSACFARAGYEGDSVAALFVAVLVILAAAG